MTNQIDLLPIELFNLIISNLTFDERLGCLLVCKEWMERIKDLKLKSLIVCDEYEGLATQKWFDTNRSINCSNKLLNTNFKFLSTLSSKQILVNLKELAIYNLSSKNGFV